MHDTGFDGKDRFLILSNYVLPMPYCMAREKTRQNQKLVPALKASVM